MDPQAKLSELSAEKAALEAANHDLGRRLRNAGVADMPRRGGGAAAHQRRTEVDFELAIAALSESEAQLAIEVEYRDGLRQAVDDATAYAAQREAESDRLKTMLESTRASTTLSIAKRLTRGK